MASTVVLTIHSEESQALVNPRVRVGADKDKEGCRALKNYLARISTGQTRAKIDVQSGDAAPVAASGTFTLASVIATDACTIGTTTFTFTSSPTLSTDVEVDGADNTADAAALAAAINAHATVSQIVTASSDGAVVTITAKQKGVVGNFIPISDADSTITTSGAFLTGGTGGAQNAAQQYVLGL